MSSFEYDTPFLWVKEEELLPVWDQIGENDFMDLDAPLADVPSGFHSSSQRVPSPNFASKNSFNSSYAADYSRQAPHGRHLAPSSIAPQRRHGLPDDEFSEAEIVFESPVGSIDTKPAQFAKPFAPTAPQPIPFQSPFGAPNAASSFPQFSTQGFQGFSPSYVPSSSAPPSTAPLASYSLNVEMRDVPQTKRRSSQPPAPSAVRSTMNLSSVPNAININHASNSHTSSAMAMPMSQSEAMMDRRRRHSHSGRLPQRTTSGELSSELELTHDNDNDLDEEDEEEHDGEWDSYMDLESDEDLALASSPPQSASVITPASRALPDPPASFKLPVSKSPIMDALCYCALQGWGMRVLVNKRATATAQAEVVFRVDDFERYYRISRSICSKQNPTEDIGARVKALRRWFANFPAKRERSDSPFDLTVRQNGVRKVRQLLQENARLLGLN